ncbi:MAG: energy transducer TonB [Sphingomonas sp.]|nr:energy transducer TonB [Sphingomonas sp.]
MRSLASGGPVPRDRRVRFGAGAAALGVHALLGLALVWGLAAPPLTPVADRALDIFDIAPPPPSEPLSVDLPPSKAEAAHDARSGAPEQEGAAAPPNLRSEATQIVAPAPVIPLPVPPPVTVAPVAGMGSAPDQGAAPVRGPGFGAGGAGEGRGAGRGGDGRGGGGEGGRGGLGRGTPPRHLSGRLSDRDYPRAAGEAGVGGTVSVRFTVGVEGRVTDCWITRSSGSRLLDVTTCRLIERRYRFAPSRDEAGRPVPADVIEDHEWLSYDEPFHDRRGSR